MTEKTIDVGDKIKNENLAGYGYVIEIKGPVIILRWYNANTFPDPFTGALHIEDCIKVKEVENEL